MAKNTTTPATTHGQKLLGLFPDWRLKSAVKNASDEELETSVESCEWWAWRGAILLMVGLIAEIILACWEPPHESIPGRWGSVFATFIVTLGVGIEVQFGKMGNGRQSELTRRAKDRLAEALVRASNAEQELIDLRIPRHEKLAGKDVAFSAALSAYTGIVFDIGMGPNDKEVEDFIWAIETPLSAAQWTQIDWMYPGGYIGIKRGGIGQFRPAIGNVAANNVLIQLHAGASPALGVAAAALAKALMDIGIKARVEGFNIHNANANAMHILIGPKR